MLLLASVKLLAEHLLDFSWVNLNAVLLGFENQYLLVDHGVENLAAECLDLLGFDKDRQPALLGLKAQSGS